jgi:hypothetical protein|tara:strand:- start:858 stop:1076 length:219 start_codon:yes stop_codon:yes gene_type:complete
MRITLTKAGNPREVVTIDSDTAVTVGDVVNQASAAFGIEGLSVFVNGVQATDTTPVQDGARISISQEAKGNA